MDVRFSHGDDSNSFVARSAQIRLEIHVRIDDDRLGASLAGQHVTGLGKPIVVESAEEHDVGR